MPHEPVEAAEVKRLFVSDCEGPISKNDNAYELAEQFVPDGGKFFANISKFDDVLADIFHKPGYTAGSTLKLVLPFFKAYGVTDKMMDDFSAQNILLIADSKRTIRHILDIADAFIVSTSYEHYIRALCKAVDFPYQNTYCTKVALNKIPITPIEQEMLREISQEIAQTRLIDIPQNAKSTEDFCECDQEILQRFDEIFWEILPKMGVGKFLDIVTVGGDQKAESIQDAAKGLNADLKDIMYVGDSITDVEAFQLIRKSGGLSVSFNGNSYAVSNAEVAVQSESNLVTAVLADVFCTQGKAAVLALVENWSPQALKQSGVNEALLRQFQTVIANGLPKVQIVTSKNKDSIITQSSEFRKLVRGVSIGRLG
jgi:energy-converting hydrogenase A subunit R